MRRRRALAAVFICLLAAPAAAQARLPSEFWGVTYGFPSFPERDLTRMKRGDVDSVRWTLFWPAVQSAPGQFNWATPDRIIGDLASRGIRTLPTVLGSAKFAAKSWNRPPVRTKRARRAWRRFLVAAADRYGPGGVYWTTAYPVQHPGAAPVPVTSWQIWNEPNLSTYFQPRPSPSRYAKLLRISHKAIASSQPDAHIVLAGMPGLVSFSAALFLDRLYKKGHVKRAFDVAAIHPYSNNMRDLRSQLHSLRWVMKRHGDRHTDVWITEIAWGSKRHGNLNVGRRGQKRMLSRSFKEILHHRHRWHVRRVFWFTWRDPKTYGGQCPWCGYAGLFDSKDRAKPSWHAYQKFSARG
jgi:hypothetical protein